MQGKILHGIMDQNKDVSGKTSEILIKSGVQLIAMHQNWFIGFENVSQEQKILTSGETE